MTKHDEGVVEISWWNCNWNGLEPETANLIEKVGYDESETGRVRIYKCGCEKSWVDPPTGAEFWFHICCWHEGYDDAATTFAARD